MSWQEAYGVKKPSVSSQDGRERKEENEASHLPVTRRLTRGPHLFRVLPPPEPLTHRPLRDIYLSKSW
jgi:hypothetical protein